MVPRAYLLHALSPLHAGTGHAADVIDLPIARMKATGIPIVPGSSVKGVLRDARQNTPADKRNNDNAWDEKVLAAFGPDNNKAEEHAGALVVGDARLLALPVRSFKGTFAWVTCPLLLRLAKRDLGSNHDGKPIPTLSEQKAMTGGESVVGHDGKLYLQDLNLTLETGKQSAEYVTAWTDWLAPLVYGKDDILSKRFAIVDDETMSFLWDTATQLDQRVRIREDTRTVASGALWLEESLPAETLLIGLMEADKSRRQKEVVKNWTADKILDFALSGATAETETILQFGGKASVGRGRCRLLPIA